MHPRTAACADGSGKGLPVQGTVVRSVARAFGLRHDETCVFADGFTLYDRLVNCHGSEDRKAKLKELDREGRAEIDAAMGRVGEAVAGKPSKRLGYKEVTRLPTQGRKYVIFSDHHYTYKGHRTNFFEESGNLQLYVEALDAYRESDFTVIENGDVEDLVIFDPTWEPGEVETRKCMDLEELVKQRGTTRQEQLKKILHDPVNAPLIEAYQRLDQDKKLIRVAGNHDYDNQKPEFLALLREVYPNLACPSDLVLLDDEKGQSEFVIMHGHQFDLATNPVSAPRFGETISETLGLYYQGPDRNWRWVEDWVEQYANGDKAFTSTLVLNKMALTENIRDRLEGKEEPLDYDVDLNPAGANSSIRALFEDMQGALFEQLFKQTIAWHYFVSASPIKDFTQEVLTGDRFFKYQLLDESWIRDELLRVFPEEKSRPTLILGHTHEVRMDSVDPNQGDAFPWYLNTGSAGRFENLIWGVEIEDGVASLVSWSRKSLPEGPVERRVWQSSKANGNSYLTAGKQVEALRPRSENTPSGEPPKEPSSMPLSED